MVTPVSIAGRLIGPGQPCWIIAEAGVNHNGDPALAAALVDAAAKAGADAVKFQTFQAATLATPTAAKAAYQSANLADDSLSQQAMLKALELSRDAHRPLQTRAAAQGIPFLSTPFAPDDAAFLVGLGVPALKVSSGDLTNLPFLAQLARYGLPLLLSTGMADLAEVAAAVATVRANGNPSLILLHCVSTYPADAADCNLRAMRTLQDTFHVPVGWSDHTIGWDVAVAAVALGACVVEKHLTLDRTMPGPDHAASLEPAELAALVLALRRTEAALGHGEKRPTPSEAAVAAVARKSLHWDQDLAAGASVSQGAVTILRPEAGLAPKWYDRLHGLRLARPVLAGSPVLPADFDPAGLPPELIQ
ncbi:MAG: N-acetylneuraminate synthase family protein [Candidatus Sericytochromatia bacterium]|nr:N-acetylneuraminate synthase family protein [Candidatus Sericytochromatia bacterium]